MKKDETPSFPDPKAGEEEWEGLKYKRPFAYYDSGVDGEPDDDYNGCIGGYIGERLRYGYTIINEDDITNDRSYDNTTYDLTQYGEDVEIRYEKTRK